MKRAAVVIGGALVAALASGSAIASAQTTVNGAQCLDGDPAAVGDTCTTSDGGAGSCLAEMCEVMDEGGTTLATCALCYAPGEAPPGDGGAIVVISTTTTTSSGEKGCGVAGGPGAGDLASVTGIGVLAGVLARRRKRSRALRGEGSKRSS